MSAPDQDRLLLRRAQSAIAVQNTVAVALILLLFGLLVAYGIAREQRAAVAHSLRQTANAPQDAASPPAGTWIFRMDTGNRLASTASAPRGLPDLAALERVRSSGTAETTTVDVDGTDYLIITEPRGSGAVQMVGSLDGPEQQRHRLLAVLGLAGLLSLAAAAAAGVLLARRATAPLAEALARQRRFVADASHELRTPVSQLHTRAQLLRQDLRAGPSTAEATADADQLVAGTRQLGEVIEDLLLSAQMPHDASTAADVDLGVVAAGVVAAFEARARDQKIDLVLDLDPDRPSLVHGREMALRRVVTSLVDNALSHTAEGGHVTVELRSHDADHAVALTVRDDGTGFDPADQERIFDRFARGHGDQRRFGLGLALAREIVTGHGGTIDAHGVPGQGAAFRICLPSL